MILITFVKYHAKKNMFYPFFYEVLTKNNLFSLSTERKSRIDYKSCYTKLLA